MKLSGRVMYRDLGPGVWVLEGDDGTTYQLAGGDRKLKKDGHRVEAEGHVDRAALTSAMVGPVFHVASYRFV
ncbi:hypothetical protein DRW03_31105 [Corallococcus sp. H22C18031201]|uniref:DUF5818 domain-containing protein n=1 Tax=Citreicoccus inhibens TaxID=2849499 RepID=UPI000E74C140|nr:DUF5818 domain-containing protein [Citreicoccus inhibens]MBJ6763948.1 hypothetical protein [Myxococcaceae bacterium JPH2]MBU8900221.1 hypothetical protein [Citreicoccus inhibens]RJS16388.1 hypothetical protein DRW03_31105 [Corallococcus sp. H22C18031201]